MEAEMVRKTPRLTNLCWNYEQLVKRAGIEQQTFRLLISLYPVHPLIRLHCPNVSKW